MRKGVFAAGAAFGAAGLAVGGAAAAGEAEPGQSYENDRCYDYVYNLDNAHGTVGDTNDNGIEGVTLSVFDENWPGKFFSNLVVDGENGEVIKIDLPESGIEYEPVVNQDTGYTMDVISWSVCKSEKTDDTTTTTTTTTTVAPTTTTTLPAPTTTIEVTTTTVSPTTTTIENTTTTSSPTSTTSVVETTTTTPEETSTTITEETTTTIAGTTTTISQSTTTTTTSEGTTTTTEKSVTTTTLPATGNGDLTKNVARIGLTSILLGVGAAALARRKEQAA